MLAGHGCATVAIARLEPTGHPYPFPHLVYEDAGHYLGVPYWPTTGQGAYHPVERVTYPGGGTPAGNARAAADVWASVLDFLAEAFPQD